MSAYFVSDATIDAVVSLMIRQDDAASFAQPWHKALADYWLAKFGRMLDLRSDAGLIGCALLEMNCDAMLARYPSIKGTAEENDMLRDALAYRFTPRNEGEPTLAKSLACFLYQCSEGTVPHSPLFIACADLKQAVTPPPASATLWRNPALWAARREYDAAPWGLEA